MLTIKRKRLRSKVDGSAKVPDGLSMLTLKDFVGGSAIEFGKLLVGFWIHILCVGKKDWASAKKDTFKVLRMKIMKLFGFDRFSSSHAKVVRLAAWNSILVSDFHRDGENRFRLRFSTKRVELYDDRGTLILGKTKFIRFQGGDPKASCCSGP